MSRRRRVCLLYDPNRDYDRACVVATALADSAHLVHGIDAAFDNPGRFATAAGDGGALCRRAMTRVHACVFLLGRDSCSSDWFAAMIRRWHQRPLPAVAVRVHMLPDRWQRVDPPGKDPFAPYPRMTFATFDWQADEGARNLPRWLDGIVRPARGVPAAAARGPRQT